jgi:hypothetical protein
VSVSRTVDDAGAGTGFYTVVTIHDREQAKLMASMVVAGTFDGCRAFAGAQVRGSDYLLIFEYEHEQPLFSGGAILEMTFEMRKATALSLVTELTQTGLPESLCALLLEGRNVNLSGTRVFYNYFLDIAQYDPNITSDAFYSKAALAAYEVLSRGFAEKLEGREEAFPHDLQVMKRRAERGGFRSYSQIIAFIRDLPDEPQPRAMGLARLRAFIARLKALFSGNAMRLLIIVLVIFTLVFLVWQVGTRLMAGAPGGNLIYNGVDYIGDQHLGDDYV